jgi:hypothetical protein
MLDIGPLGAWSSREDDDEEGVSWSMGVQERSEKP